MIPVKILVPFMLVMFLIFPAHRSIGASPDLAANTFNVELWPDGVVHYRYCQDDPGCLDLSRRNCPNNDPDCLDFTGEEYDGRDTDKERVKDMMDVWEHALEITDPLTHRKSWYIRFVKCTNDCPESHVLIRYNRSGEDNNMCTYFERDAENEDNERDAENEDNVEKVGKNPKGQTVFHLTGPGKQPRVVILHELGHCLGLWHEQNRQDRDRWLHQFPTPKHCVGKDGVKGEVNGKNDDGKCTDSDYQTVKSKAESLLPLLGNYDYDSIMHYPSYNSYGELRWADPVGNTFLGNTWEIRNVAPARALLVSERDKSRLLQYYAHERNSNWGFFRSLSHLSYGEPDELPNSHLADGVEAVGTPAIVYESFDNEAVFARGSDNQLYWKGRERYVVREANPDRPPYKPIIRSRWSAWKSIGCCFSSDPSAVSRKQDRIDVVAINDEGEVQLIRYIDEIWQAPLTLRGGHPTGGLKQAEEGGYVGPTIASRGANSLDVFVVRDDGRLAVTTWRDGNWEAWRTLGQGYDVTARPAAVALSATQVQLAINASDINLYEPLVTFPSASFTLGDIKATTAPQSPPALAKRNGQISRYYVFITNASGRISYRLSEAPWRDVGGIPRPGTGPSAVATGNFTFKVVINGEDATSCVEEFCHPEVTNPGQVIQPGGVWIRDFD